MTKGTVTIGYKDSRFAWDKEFILTTFPKSVTLSNGDSTEGWTAFGGASLAMDRGMIRISPRVARKRSDFHTSRQVRQNNNGRITLPLGQVDFGFKPLLKLNIADQDGAGTVIGLLDGNGQWRQCADTGGVGVIDIDLASMTKWEGIKEASLTIDPATSYGGTVRIRSVKLCYP